MRAETGLMWMFCAIMALLSASWVRVAEATAAPEQRVDQYFYNAEADQAVLPPAPAAGDNGGAAKSPTVSDPKLVDARIVNEFRYVAMLCAMSVISLVVVLYFVKMRQGSASDMIHSAGLTLIIYGTIILVLVASTSEQLTAAIGVLGAIAGYLFRSVQEGGGGRKEPAPGQPD